ncbi:MAG: CHAD domain-containing protein, partial [Verrucomicrobiota bacterium]
DYRVCLRKIRSVIGLMKKVYPAAETERLKVQWGNLTRATNRLRDLDVYLLEEKTCRALLPDPLSGGLDAFFDQMREERGREWEQVGRHLRSPGYREKMEALDAFFSGPDRSMPSACSQQPIQGLASRLFDMRYRSMIRANEELVDTSPDEKFHDLRIQGKKLRYMLEFFREIYDPDPLAPLLKSLRRVQNRLGRFNDCAVQQEVLMAWLEQTRASRTWEETAAVGGLVTWLHQREPEERQKAREALSRFGRPAIRKRFETIFKSKTASA